MDELIFVGIFSITNSIYLLIKCLFRFFISSCVDNLYLIICVSSKLSNFHRIGSDVHSFSPDFDNWCFFCFSLAVQAYLFCLYFKRKNLDLLIFLFSVLYFIDFQYNFYYSLLLLALYLLFYFSSFIRSKFSSVNLSSLLIQSPKAITVPLSTALVVSP